MKHYYIAEITGKLPYPEMVVSGIGRSKSEYGCNDLRTAKRWLKMLRTQNPKRIYVVRSIFADEDLAISDI